MSVSRSAVGATVLALVLASGCAGDEEPTGTPGAAETAPRETEPPEEGIDAQAAWSYDGETGPEQWAELDASYATCGSGEQQSPIDVSAAPVAESGGDVDPVSYDYMPATFELVNEVYTVKASSEEAGGLTLGGERYELLQFHVHGPSEHTLDGERTELGVHLVHQNADDELAVVQLFFEPTSGEQLLSDVFSDLPREEGEATTVEDFDVTTLLPDDRSTFRYDGSLTTPPCTEGVRWIVMQEALPASEEAISDLRDVIGETARPLQPLNGRDVLVAED